MSVEQLAALTGTHVPLGAAILQDWSPWGQSALVRLSFKQKGPESWPHLLGPAG